MIMDYALLAPLKEAPTRSGILTDLDGTISPIAQTPQKAYVDRETRELLRALKGKYRLVAVVSGRPAKDAAEMVGIADIIYSGNHGLEMIASGRMEECEEAMYFRNGLRETMIAVESFRLPGVTVEDKGIGGFAVHYRESRDPCIREQVEHLLERAVGHAGFEVREGRKVFEVRPPVNRNKSDVVKQLCLSMELNNGLYMGDDMTDIDAFRGLRDGIPGRAVCIAVDSPEAPEYLRESADIVIPSQEEVARVLRHLAD